MWQVTWCPYQGSLGDELIVVLEGCDLFEMDIWLHAPQIVITHVVNRAAWQLKQYKVISVDEQVISVDEAIMSLLYLGWIP